jgi:hypothetical protein
MTTGPSSSCPVPKSDHVEDAVVEVVAPPGASRLAILRGCLAVVFVVCAIGWLAWRGGLSYVFRSECFNVAQAIATGRGFADPFDGRTGPTAWMPPIPSLFLAAVLYVGEGNRDLVNQAVIAVQIVAFIGAFVLVLIMVRQNRWLRAPEAAAAVFLLITLAHYRKCFLLASIDSSLLLIGLNLTLAGLSWGKPFADKKRATAWGMFGGLVALTGPVAGFAWAGTSAALALRERAWSRLALMVLGFALVLAPWTIRNYLVFGRLIPVKSNAAFEAYQCQIANKTGLLVSFHTHPYSTGSLGGREYRALGETAFLDKKREQFWQSVQADPENFFNRVFDRFLAATLQFPIERAVEPPWVLRLSDVVHPLPFVAFTILLLSGMVGGLTPARWCGLGIYSLYLLPYIAISYYDRYSMSLLGVKTLLVVWAADEVLGWGARLIRRSKEATRGR